MTSKYNLPTLIHSVIDYNELELPVDIVLIPPKLRRSYRVSQLENVLYGQYLFEKFIETNEKHYKDRYDDWIYQREIYYRHINK